MSIRNCWRCFRTFLKREDGPTAVEYAVMLALIVVICLTAVELLGRNSSALFQTVAESIASAAE